MNASLTVEIDDELLNEILGCARELHPRETIMLLRGKRKKEALTVSELVIPPFAKPRP